jgi:branched-chain amino acid transport system substrate-binding protein
MKQKHDMKTAVIGNLAIILGGALVLSGCSLPEEEGAIRIGQITNRTGDTSDVGVPLADGVRDAWRWINEQGGVRGQPVRLIERECGYNVPRTIAAFRELSGDLRVPLIHGFGTPDSEAVMELAARARVIYMPTSYDERFVDPNKAPYFFITTADYSTAGRSAVRYVAQHGGRLGLARNPGGFGMAPIAAIKEEAAKHNLPIASEQDLEYTPTSAVQQALAFRNAGATHIWVGNTHTAMAVLARDLRRQGSDAVLIGNMYAGDENFIRTAGPEAEGHLTVYGSVVYGDTSASVMEAIMAANYHSPNTHYIRGWAQALLAAEVIGRAIDQGLELTGENLREMFYTLENFSPGGLIPPVTYRPGDHRPNTTAPIYQVRDGKWVKVWENGLPQP